MGWILSFIIGLVSDPHDGVTYYGEIDVIELLVVVVFY